MTALLSSEKRSPPGGKGRRSGIILLVLAGVLGMFLLFLGNFGQNPKTEREAEETDGTAQNSPEVLRLYAEALETKIAALCERVDGVSSVRVAVTLESGYEYVYAKDAVAKEGDGTLSGSYTYVVVGSGSGEHLIYLSEKPPVIGGIGIVCRGGGDARVRKELTELICAAFSVGANQIYIAEGE